MDQGKVLLRQLGLHLHLAAFRKPEQRSGSRADDLADLHIAGQDQAARGSKHVETAKFRSARRKLGLRDAYLSVCRIARGFLGVYFRLRDEAATQKAHCAFIIVLRESRIGARGIDLRCELSRLLRLHGAVDYGEDLTCADPAAGVDKDALNAAALSRDPDRLIAFRCERTASGHEASDVALAGHDYGHSGRLRGTLGSRRCILFLVPAQEEKRSEKRNHEQAYGGNDCHAPATTAIHDHERVRASKTRRFPIHVHSFALAYPRIFQHGACAVLRE
jgi:hypothetical protein